MCLCLDLEKMSALSPCLHSWKDKLCNLLKQTFGQNYSHVDKKNYYSKKFPLLGGHHNLAGVESGNWSYHLASCVHAFLGIGQVWWLSMFHYDFY